MRNDGTQKDISTHGETISPNYNIVFFGFKNSIKMGYNDYITDWEFDPVERNIQTKNKITNEVYKTTNLPIGRGGFKMIQGVLDFDTTKFYKVTNLKDCTDRSTWVSLDIVTQEPTSNKQIFIDFTYKTGVVIYNDINSYIVVEYVPIGMINSVYNNKYTSENTVNNTIDTKITTFNNNIIKPSKSKLETEIMKVDTDIRDIINKDYQVLFGGLISFTTNTGRIRKTSHLARGITGLTFSNYMINNSAQGKILKLQGTGSTMETAFVQARTIFMSGSNVDVRLNRDFYVLIENNECRITRFSSSDDSHLMSETYKDEQIYINIYGYRT